MVAADAADVFACGALTGYLRLFELAEDYQKHRRASLRWQADSATPPVGAMEVL
jgi:hypothetical protein